MDDVTNTWRTTTTIHFIIRTKVFCEGDGCGACCIGNLCASGCKGDGCGDGCTGFRCADGCVDSAGNVGPNAENPAAQCGCGAAGTVNTCTSNKKKKTVDTCAQPKSKKGKSKGKSAKSMTSKSKSSKSTKAPKKGRAAALEAKQAQAVRLEVGAGVALVGMIGFVALVATKLRASVVPGADAAHLLAATATAPLATAAEASPGIV